jgi:hypothetical protein
MKISRKLKALTLSLFIGAGGFVPLTFDTQQAQARHIATVINNNYFSKEIHSWGMRIVVKSAAIEEIDRGYAPGVLGGIISIANGYAGVGVGIASWSLSNQYRSCGNRDFNIDFTVSNKFSNPGYITYRPQKFPFGPAVIYRYTCR